jgi:hypothetical protein
LPATYKSFSERLLTILRDMRGRWTGARLDKTGQLYQWGSIIAGGVMGGTSYAKNRYNSTRPDLATGDDLLELAEDVYGTTKNSATTARWIKCDATVTGTGSWATGLTATNAAGLSFTTVNSGSWTSAGTQTVYISSTSTGQQCNLVTGAEVTLAAPPANMEATLVVSGWHTTRGFPAVDDEEDADLQQRLGDRVGGTPTSANEAAYQAWCLADDLKTIHLDNGEDLVARCYIYPKVRSILDVSAVPMLSWNGITMQPSVAGTFLSDIEDYVDDQAPRAADFDAVQFTEDSQSIRVTLDTDAGYGRDWGSAATTSMTTHAATACTSSRLYLAAGEVTAGGIATGDRVLCHVGTNFFPNVRVATSVDSTNDFVDVDTPFTDENGQEATVALGDIVRPGGPLTQAVIDAILEMFSKMSPADTSAEVRWPPVSQAHPVDLTAGLIHHTIRDASEHIFDVTINTGTATCTASTPGGGVLVAYVLSPTRADDWCRIEYTDLNT